VEEEGDVVSVSFPILVGICGAELGAVFSVPFVDSGGIFNEDGCPLNIFFEGVDEGI
jgi:hypothetical protein